MQKPRSEGGWEKTTQPSTGYPTVYEYIYGRGKRGREGGSTAELGHAPAKKGKGKKKGEERKKERRERKWTAKQYI